MKKVVKLSSEIGKQKTPQSIDLRGFFNSGGGTVRILYVQQHPKLYNKPLIYNKLIVDTVQPHPLTYNVKQI
ncbi:hypothetical protein HALA3H3_880006 [Halomonas sp. A3H3]|nr:hypothetical protein HALA3H3_880006 [Halomonas sp. A3H3]